MTAKNVLNKILTLLSSEEVEFTDAKSANGDILQSPTFDLNEPVEVVHEDGTKTVAPDGEYEISLKDESGNENIIRIHVRDGKVQERENVEEEKNEESENEETEMSDAGTPEDPTKGDTQNRKDTNSVPGAKVADTKQSDVKMATTIKDAPKDAAKNEEAKSLPNTTDEDPRNRVGNDTDDQKDPIIALSYRIDELEKAMKMMVEKMGSEETPVDEETPSEDEAVPDDTDEVAMSEEEEELPKLDGAPIETATRFSADSIHKPNYGKKVGDAQSNFLSKLYN